MDSEIFERLSPTRLFFRCAIPSMVTMVFGALYQIADGLFVGRFIGENALAAVNIVMPIIMIVFALSDMVAAGASVRISVLWGAKKREEASDVFSFTLRFIVALSFGAAVLGLCFAERVVRLLAPNAAEQAIEYGVTYFRIYAAFSPFTALSQVTDNFLRVCGREKFSMGLGIGTQLFNIVLDVLLIALLHQGVWAAAFTSCSAMALGAVISLCMFRRKKSDLYYTGKKLPALMFGAILANGISEFFGSISASVMSIAYNFFLLNYGGTTGVAAFSVIMYVDSVIGMAAFGICDALQPAISYCYGAGLQNKVKSIFKRLIAGAGLLSLASMLFMMLAGRSVAPLFVKPEDSRLLEVSIAGMRLFALSYLTGWVDVCFSSYFTALERPIRSLLTSLFGTLIFPLLFLSVLTPVFCLNGVWYAVIAASAASAILTVILALSMKVPAEQSDGFFPRGESGKRS